MRPIMDFSTSLWNCYCALFLVSLHLKNTDAGIPTLLRRLVREIYPEIDSDEYGSLTDVCILGDVVYSTGEVVPADEPCLKCKCQPPGVHCETVKCLKKTGCKAVHHPNKCCPDYQCECHHKERVYANGEKLKSDYGGECKVCYCRGGEIQCTEVSCYVRTDCEGKRVDGQCCPKYDHCPVTEDKTTTEEDTKETTTTQPAVLRIGDKLLVLTEGNLTDGVNSTTNSTSVITIIGAEGLEPGFDSEYSLFNNSNDLDLEPKASESTHILSLVKHKIEQTTTTEEERMITVTDRSIESLEELKEESGENTTPKDNYTLTIDSFNTTEVSESADMLRPLNITDEIDEVQSMQNSSEELNFSTEDVEMFDVNETSTKSLTKRESSDEVFRQLEAELDSDSIIEKNQTEEEEKQEAEKIFQELLDEISTPKTVKKEDKNKDVETIDKISDAIATFAFKNKKEGTNVLGAITNLLNLQHRFGKKK